MATLRFKVVEDAIKRKALDVPAPEKRPSEYYGMYVFNEEKNAQNTCPRKPTRLCWRR